MKEALIYPAINRHVRKLRCAFPSLAAVIFVFALLPANAEGLMSPFEKAAERAAALHSAPKAARGETPRVLGGIAPHHDLALPMIVRFYDRLAPDTRRVWLLAPDHFRRVRNLAAVCGEDWTLSERTLEADAEALGSLRAMKIVEERPEIFAGEHGITLHIPLIARYFAGAKVVPMLLNPKIPDVGLLILRKKLRELLKEGDIVILSMDLSHYKTPEAMAAEDVHTLEVLKSLRFGAAGGIGAEARRAAALALMLFKDMGALRGEILEHTDSSAILGYRVESGTSYATVTYRPERPF
jgi:AmmeMemoRadiSam system protein B